jgi:hypothetical protein
VYGLLKAGFRLVIGFIGYLHIVTEILITLLLTFAPQSTPRYSLQSVCTSLHGFITQELLKLILNHTLPIPLYYSTHKVFKSHVKSSQADFLYSSILLQLTAACKRPTLPPINLRRWPTENMSRGLYPLLCDVTAYAEVCLPSRCLETAYITPLFHRCSARTWKMQPPPLLQVGPCLQRCCLTTRWTNPSQYYPPMLWSLRWLFPFRFSN